MKKINSKNKRKFRNRKKLKKVNVNRYRITVTKSLNNISAQIIDDKQKKTLISASSIEKDIKIKKIKKWKNQILLEKYWQKEQKKKILVRYTLTEVDINITEE